jgi:hypothetical protein
LPNGGLAVEAIAQTIGTHSTPMGFDFQKQYDFMAKLNRIQNPTLDFFWSHAPRFAAPVLTFSQIDQTIRNKPIMSQQPELTPKQQQLMNF